MTLEKWRTPSRHAGCPLVPRIALTKGSACDFLTQMSLLLACPSCRDRSHLSTRPDTQRPRQVGSRNSIKLTAKAPPLTTAL